jgi:hypothetical protein
MLPYRDLPTHTTDGIDLASANRTVVPPLRPTQPPPGNALRGRVEHTTRAKSTNNCIAISFGKRQWSALCDGGLLSDRAIEGILPGK